MVHSVSGRTRGVQVKLWDPLRTRAIPERLRGVFTTRRYTNPPLSLPFTLPYLICTCSSGFSRWCTLLLDWCFHRRSTTIAPRSANCTGWRQESLKLALLVYRCQHGAAPSYLADELIQPADLEGRRRLRSVSSPSLIVRGTRASSPIYNIWAMMVVWR